MDKRINGLTNYLDGAHSVFHAVEGLRHILEAQGYTRLQESYSSVVSSVLAAFLVVFLATLAVE